MIGRRRGREGELAVYGLKRVTYLDVLGDRYGRK